MSLPKGYILLVGVIIFLILLFASILNCMFFEGMYYSYLFQHADELDKAVSKLLDKDFELDALIKVGRLSPPVIGKRMDYIVTFTDENKNYGTMMIDRKLNKYILIYNNLTINIDENILYKQNEQLIERLRYDLTYDNYKVVQIVKSVAVKKSVSNINEFQSGEVLVVEVIKHNEYFAPVEGGVTESTENTELFFFDLKSKSSFNVNLDYFNKNMLQK